MQRIITVLICAAAAISFLAFVWVGNEYESSIEEYQDVINNLEKQLEQQESKNRVLQEENASLIDYFWSMNQDLMKEDAKYDRAKH